jgi:pimeloyl-ACP methyl ester carboxylesterase
MAAIRQVLFIQGGGAGAHDDWDASLVDSLRGELGDGYEVRYPRMPQEHDPSYVLWSAAIRQELTALDDGAVVLGHSVGGTILISHLASAAPERRLGLIMLVAAPFVGAGGWSGGEVEVPQDLGARLPRGVPVHLFHGLGDQMVPPEHLDLYAGAIPEARVHRMPGRDHQLNDDLNEVAHVIAHDVRSIGRATSPPDARLVPHPFNRGAGDTTEQPRP